MESHESGTEDASRDLTKKRGLKYIETGCMEEKLFEND